MVSFSSSSSFRAAWWPALLSVMPCFWARELSWASQASSLGRPINDRSASHVTRRSTNENPRPHTNNSWDCMDLRRGEEEEGGATMSRIRKVDQNRRRRRKAQEGLNIPFIYFSGSKTEEGKKVAGGGGRGGI